MSDLESKLKTIESKIQQEQFMLQKSQEFLKITNNRNVLSQNEQLIQQSEKNLVFLIKEREKLERRKTVSSREEGGSGAESLDTSLTNLTMVEDPGEMTNPSVKLTPLEMRKADAPLSREMISFRLQEIKYKRNVEENLKDGFSKLNSVYMRDPNVGDNWNQVKADFIESSEKYRIYSQALRRYESINIGIPDEEYDEEIDMFWMKQGIRRPLSGLLTIKLNSARYLQNYDDSESYLVIKVSGKKEEQTKLSRVDKWNEEFEIEMVNANEMEVIVYNVRKDGSAVPIGLLWIPISELSGDLRKKNAGTSGWAPADMKGQLQASTHDLTQINSESIDGWWKLEPAGELLMELKFEKRVLKKRAVSKLGRQGAVKKTKEVVAELRGHKFAAKQFYQIMTCAFCNKFLVNTIGYQCQDCRYFCHENCAPKVVLKCIAKPNYELDAEEQKINLLHRIHHRFDSYSALMAKWCCHCGYMIPPGRGKGKKCTDCGVTCHDTCQHLVPNFCGMTMAMANQMLEKSKAQKPVKSSTFPAVINKPDKLKPSSGSKLKIAPPVEPRPESIAKNGVTIKNFNLISVLGRGNFGKVMLAEEKSTSNLYAIKVLKKEFILQSDEVEGTKSEKRVFLTANRERHPFLVGLHSCFQSNSSIYFVMEYISGGDLMWHIQRKQFTEERARFYAVEVLLALEYFHQNNIVYRDLKLDNILLASDGHIKIADYGLCKENMGYGATTSTFCGTPEFMAPEIILEQPYGRAVDWWAFGVLLYEMILGQSPFHGDDEDEIFDAILDDDILYPLTLDRESVSILQKLLNRDPNRRLGGGPEDAADVKRHPYFQGISWEDFLAKRVTPPHIPVIKSPTDTSNFDTEFTKEAPILTPSNSILSPADQAGFQGFTYVAEWVDQPQP